MKKVNISINGTIGVGKTTIMNALAEKMKENNKRVIIQPEPSVTVPFINEILQKFYNNNSNWSYPLQLLITAAQEAYMQELKEAEYDYALMDMAYSSDIYSYSHQKHGRMTLEDHYRLLNSGRQFKFDYIIWLNEEKEITINRVQNRNKRVKEGDLDPDKKDIAIADFSYLDSHIADFQEYFPIYIEKFKKINPNIKIIKINHIPDKNSIEYSELINNIYNQIISEGK